MDVFRKIKTGLVGNPADIQSKALALIEKLDLVNNDIKKVKDEVDSLDKDLLLLKYTQSKLDASGKEEDGFLNSIKIHTVSNSISSSNKKLDKLNKDKRTIKARLELISSKQYLPGLAIPLVSKSSTSRKASSVATPKVYSPLQPLLGSSYEPPKRSLQSKVKSQIKKNPKTVKAVGAGLAVIGAYGLYKTVKRKSSKTRTKRKSSKTRTKS
jgi:hypothetical protein